MIKLSKRLSICVKAVKKYKRIADVGTDHALVPAYLIENDLADFVIASDINLGPLQQGETTLKKLGYVNDINTKIKLVQAAGISHLTHCNLVDAIIIAGMGGDLISSIISDNMSIAKSVKKMVLQANSKIKNLRTFLYQNSFEIVNEHIIKEDGKFYEILEVVPSTIKVNYSNIDLTYGPILSKNKSSIFIEKWSGIAKKKEDILANINSNTDLFEKLKIELSEIKKIVGYINE